jgi:hypothetical protein
VQVIDVGCRAVNCGAHGFDQALVVPLKNRLATNACTRINKRRTARVRPSADGRSAPDQEERGRINSTDGRSGDGASACRDSESGCAAQEMRAAIISVRRIGWPRYPASDLFLKRWARVFTRGLDNKGAGIGRKHVPLPLPQRVVEGLSRPGIAGLAPIASPGQRDPNIDGALRLPYRVARTDHYVQCQLCGQLSPRR